MAMTLRLDEHDDKLLGERAHSDRRSKQDIVCEAVHLYLTDPVRRLEDLEDQAAIAQYELQKHQGAVTYTPHDEARALLGLPNKR